MTTLKLTHDIELTVHRCFECGRFWAAESGLVSGVDCPRCLFIRRSELYAMQDKRDRTIAGLRGALARKGRKP